jgi:transcriptional regulator with XRE-family HTH domain
MDAVYTGNRILELRKEKGLSQKEFADKLNVTDKAVSKLERGLNFPDLFVLEKIANEFNISLVALLGIEDLSKEDAAKNLTEIAQEERTRVVNDFKIRGIFIIVLGLMIFISDLYASKILADNNLYGLPMVCTMGMLGFVGVIIGNGIAILRYGIRH